MPDTAHAIVEALIASEALTFKNPETPQERRSRLAINEERVRHEHWRDRVLIYGSLAGLGILGLVGIVILFLPGLAAESRTWAAATLSSIVTGIVGYSLGRPWKAP